MFFTLNHSFDGYEKEQANEHWTINKRTSRTLGKHAQQYGIIIKLNSTQVALLLCILKCFFHRLSAYQNFEMGADSIVLNLKHIRFSMSTNGFIWTEMNEIKSIRKRFQVS